MSFIKSILIILVVFVMIAVPAYVRAADMKSIDDYLPGDWGERLNINVELRYRFESRDNFDFSDTADDEDSFHLSRTRINFDLDANKYIRAFLQLQDSRIWKAEFSNKAPYKDDLDIRQGYIDLKNIVNGNITFRIGRQELSYGDQRLIGGFNWSNVAQSFDALKLIYETDEVKIDLFSSRKVSIETNDFNEWDDDDNFYGIYGTYKGIDRHIVDLYYLFRDTDREISFGSNVGSEKMDESTIGVRIVGKELKGFDYGLEAMFQFGNFGSQDIEAFAIVLLGGYTLNLPWRPRIGFEWDHASGDDDSGDGERNTFDNLYPTNHMHYAYMDRASLQNLNNFRFTASANPTKKLKLQTDLHILYLDETQDSLYNAGRTAIRTAASSDVDDHIGTELDLLMKYAHNDNIKILAGYSHFFSGGYLKDTGSNDDGDFLYLQTTLTF